LIKFNPTFISKPKMFIGYENDKLAITTIDKEKKKRNQRFLVATPLWPSVGVKPNTSKVGDLESFGTPECLEFDNRDQNTSH
jgi:hypothetical protein